MKNRKIVTIEQLAEYFGVHRNTMSTMIIKENVNLRDIRSVFGFVNTHYEEFVKKSESL